MKKSFLIIVAFAIAIITMLSLNSCNDNPCETPAIGENFLLSDTIKAFVSNYENAEKIIFLNESGDEVEFNVSEFDDFKSEYLYGGTCQDDATMSQTISGNSQFIQFFLLNPIEISDPIYISLSEIPVPPNDIDTKESLVVSLGIWPSVSSEEGDGLFGIRFDDVNSNFIFHDSLEINSKIFYSVFEPDNLSPTPNLDIKYTQNEGIIFIGDPNTGKEYVYERKE